MAKRYPPHDVDSVDRLWPSATYPTAQPIHDSDGFGLTPRCGQRIPDIRKIRLRCLLLHLQRSSVSALAAETETGQNLRNRRIFVTSLETSPTRTHSVSARLLPALRRCRAAPPSHCMRHTRRHLSHPLTPIVPRPLIPIDLTPSDASHTLPLAPMLCGPRASQSLPTPSPRLADTHDSNTRARHPWPSRVCRSCAPRAPEQLARLSQMSPRPHLLLPEPHLLLYWIHPPLLLLSASVPSLKEVLSTMIACVCPRPQGPG